MTVDALLDELRRRGVVLRAEGDKLGVRAPPGALDPSTRALLASHKAEILARIGGMAASPAGPAPLSHAQRGLWLVAALDPEGSAYNLAIVIRLSGPLDVSALERSLRAIVQRHEVLRTTFSLVSGEPMALVAEGEEPGLTRVDLRGLPDGEAERRTSIEAQATFDLEKGPLLRATLLRTGDEEHRLLLTVHHIVFDVRSTGILLRELEAHFAAFSRGEPPRLPPLPMQYADVARWQQRPDDPALSSHLAYWRQALNGLPPPLRLPSDRPYGGVRTQRGGRVGRGLPDPLTRDLVALSRREGGTLFMTLLSAFAVLLGRLGEQSDLVVGVPTAGRDRSGTEGLIGCFVNTLAARVDLDGAPTFAGLLARVRAVALSAYAHADVPFERVVAEVQPERQLGRTPIFQVMFNLVTLDDERLALPGVTAHVEQTMPGSRFDLTLYAYQRRDAVELSLAYSADLFDQDRAEVMLAQLVALLEQVARRPDLTIASLTLPPPPGLDPKAPLAEPRQEPVTEQIAAWARRAPELVALRQGDHAMTYRELDEAARAVAATLVQRGLGGDAAVAVTGSRSFGLITAMLGALLAGSRLLTLDPALPAARRRLMVERARVTHALRVGEARPDDEGVLAGVEVVDVPSAGVPLPRAPRVAGAAALRALDPDGAAYVFFTSGSTGAPKAVLGCHKGLSHFLGWEQRTFGVGPGDRVAQLTGLSFDVVLRDVLLPLVSGAALVLPDEERPDPDRLLRWMDREAITLLHAVPSLAETWLREVPPGVSLRALRVTLFAGEPLSDTLVRRWRAAFPEAGAVVNLYGPTETTLAKCFYVVPAEPSPGVQPVGQPLPETQALVLSEGRLCGVGEPGEITLRTPFRSLGYLDAPAETEARFVPDPFGGDVGDRLYRTGDRGRYRPDGMLEIQGRLDHQIKIRGTRVEPGEVEAALREHPSVREVLVMARDVGPEKRLSAYVVLAAGAGAVPLRGFLAQRLPAALVPDAFVTLDSLPLTPNGKVDRAALPSAGAPSRSGEPSVGPRGPVEEAIVSIFREVLGRGDVGVADGFFELGGHSLQATQVISRIRRALGVDLPLRALFEAPTPAAVAARVEAGLRGPGEAIEGPLALDPALPEGPRRPVSFAEERLWLLDQIEQGGAEYVIPWAARILGPLDAGALRRALTEIRRRHDALRTTFVGENGRPVALVDSRPEIDLTVTPAPAGTPADREAEVRRAVAVEIQKPFDLARGPLLRAQLFAVGEDDHFLVLSLHHIVADGWTVGLLVRELGPLYAACAGGEPEPTPQALGYGSYARWQRGWLSGAILDRQLSYWTSRLEGAPAELGLPTDRPRPPAASHRGARRWTTLSPTASHALAALSQREGVTLFMTLLAALDVLLFRHTGERDLVVGTPIANRTRAETEPLVGLLANTLALRVRLDPERPFRDLLQRVREECLGAYAHQDLPFERLVQELAPERHLRRAPIFQVMLTLQNAPAEPPALPGLAVRPEILHNGTAKVDLAFTALPGPAGLSLAVDYSTDLFDGETIARLSGHLASIFEAIAVSPERCLHDLPLLSAAERHRLLFERNQTQGPRAGDTLLHQLFEAQAARTPEVVAVVLDGETWTYRDVDARADALAWELQRLGVGADVPVGLCLTRSLEMVVAVLGVLKAGGAYVPIDLSYPPERIDLMIEDARLPVLVTHPHLRQTFAGRAPQIVTLGPEPPAPASEGRDGPPPCPAKAESLAYVIYTSGSTGRPKAAMIPHRAIVNHMLWMQARFPLGPGDVVLQKTPLSFDASVWELHAPLAAGARLALASPDGHRDTEYLTRTLAEQRVTVLQVVPSLLELLLLEPGFAASTSLRLLYSGGEPLRASLAERAGALLGVPIVNLYGPTEAAVDATYEVAVAHAGAVQPIGRPIANVRAYVLDARLDLVPEGVEGELYLGGDGVGRGYLGRPDLTAERFLPDPFGAPGARLYRTGDRARILASGRIEALGRADDQVKIRGHRVELGEIEAALVEHPAVREAVAMVREDAPGERRLVAYVVGAGAPAEELRRFLRVKLPEVMLPSAFVPIERLPVSASGKVDRRALPIPAPAGAVDERYAPPRSVIEEQLAEAWAEVLRLPRVGIHDHFFEIGGDSILSIQLAARVRQAGLQLTPRHLFERPTIAELAAFLGPAAPVHAEQGPVTGAAPLTPIQRAFLALDLVDAHHHNQALLLEASDPLDPAALERAAAAVLNHHDALRLRIERIEGRSQQRFGPPVESVSLGCVDLGALPAAERSRAVADAAAAAQGSLDHERGPVLRMVLFTRGEGERDRLLVVIHHLAVDAVSWGVVVDDLWTAYARVRRGLAPRLPPKTTSFMDWATRLQAHAEGDAIAQEAGYWRAQATAACRLPIDHEVGDNTEEASVTLTRIAGPLETEALRRRAPETASARLDELLLAALTRALAPWAGPGALRIDLEGHGREPLFDDVDLTRTVGWFTTIFPLVLDLSPEQSPGEALHAVQQRLRAVPSRGIGYGLLHDRLGHPPPAELCFNYLGHLDGMIPAHAPLRRAAEPSGPLRAPRARRRALLDVNAMVVEGRLQVRWTYGAGRHRRETVEALADRLMDALRELAEPAEGELATGAQALAPMAEGMLFHTLLASRPDVYLTQRSLLLRGPLDASLLAAAFQDVIDRHPSLRAGVGWEGTDRPVRRVSRAAALPVERRDLGAIDPGAQATAIEEIESADRQRGFDLSRPPLMRLTLIRLSDDAWRVLWTWHHLLLDGWSTQIVLGEALARYDARARGVARELPRRRPYSDYLAWLARQDSGPLEAFWRARLSGFREPTRLGVDLPAPGDGEGGDLAEQRRTLGTGVVALLAETARRLKVTVGTVALGAWAILLSRYSGDDDVLFGATVSGRSAPVEGIASMVGLFINTLPVRVAIDPARPLGAWLAGLFEQQAALRDVEHTPLVDVLGWSEVPRGTPLFESLFVFESYPLDPLAEAGAKGLTVAEPRTFSRTTYPLTVAVAARNELHLEISYDRRRFEDGVVERMLGHLATVFEAMAPGLPRPVGDLPLLAPWERRRLLVEWSATAPGSASEPSIHERFEAQAARTPEATAVVSSGAVLRYRDLDELSAGVAADLASAGVGPGARVAVLMPRGLELVIAELGVLKAGAAFVPLDPEWPAARLAGILAELAAEAAPASLAPLLVDGTTAALARGLDHPVHLVDREGVRVAAGALAPRRAPFDGEQPIYVIYTSGSTGKPKGVVVPHRGVNNRLRWMSEFFGEGTAASVLQTTRPVYDSSVWQIFWPLVEGGKTVLPAPGEEASAEAVARLVAAEAVTMTDFVPSVFAAIVPTLVDGDGMTHALRSLRAVVVGGEEITAGAVGAFRARFPGVRVVNLYGPTEASIGCVCHEIRGDEGARIPIGRPISGAVTLVLDRRGGLSPIGAVGELHLTGHCLGIGYLGDPERTAAAFVDNPFPEILYPRLYRTGDLVRYLADGSLEFIGRADQQVKLRGVRIELGEIAAALESHPGVAASTALVREDRPGDRRLVAYVVPRGRLEIEALRRHVEARLPRAMLPSAFVLIEALPLGAGGKLDRGALPAPPGTGGGAEAAVAPRDPIEEALAGIFSEVLGGVGVGAHGDFFELGGHSLLATSAMARVRAAFAVDLPLRALFEAPTPALLRPRIEAALAGGVSEPLPPIEPVGSGEELPLSFAQERLWFSWRFDPGGSAYVIPLVLRIEGALDRSAIERAIREVVRRHEVLRTTFASSGGRPVQIVREVDDLVVALEDLGDLPAEEREESARRRTAALAARPFDLEAGPPFRSVLLRLSENDHVLVMTMHHIVSDGWTCGVLTREVSTLYAAFVEGGASPLPELPIQVVDHAVWQRRRLEGPRLDRQLDYWHAKLSGAPEVIDLPADRPRPAAASGRGAQHVFSLPPAATKALLALGRREGTTLFMTLLAAFDVLLYRTTGQRDLVVGTPIAGRTQAETERLAGFFVNVLALRVEVSAESPFRALLRRARETCLEAYAHQDAPFERVVQRLAPARDPGWTPIFQVMIALQDAPSDPPSMPGLALRRVPLETTTALCELTLVAARRDQGLELAFEYATDRFDAATVARTAGHLLVLLHEVAAGPHRSPADLPWLTAEERRSLDVWSRPSPAPARAPSPGVVELFEAQVARAPSAVALEIGREQVSYGELHRRVLRLSRRLASAAVGPDVVVGILAERSVEMMVGILAVLRAGGAWVPLAPEDPHPRTAWVTRDAGAQCVLASARFAAAAARLGPRVIPLEGDTADGAAEEPAPPPALPPSRLAYVIYTSGSTGRPKGAMIDHRSLASYLRFAVETFSLGPSDAVLQLTPFTFDASVLELLAPLVAGARMVIAEPGAHRDPDEIARVAAAHRVTLFQLVPTMLASFVERGRHAELPALRHLVCGGEPLAAELAARFVAGSRAALHNVYGTTEAADVSTLWTVLPGAPVIPIGRPVAGAEVHVLDAGMARVPVGVTGELYVGGGQVGRGYVGRPDLTAERFVPDPYGEPGGRLYRTGDLARWSSSGEIEIVGRVDDQIKVRGHRVELGEIEAVLAQHEGVGEAVVVARDGALRAWVTAPRGPGSEPLDVPSLRAFVRARLPVHMVPLSVEVIPRVPLLPSGKVDRAALRAGEPAAVQGNGPGAPPRDLVEEDLVAIWEEVLGRRPIGVHDGFFESGGHSLLAVRLLDRVRDRFASAVPLAAFFQHPTVAALAELLRRRGRETGGLGRALVVPIRATGSKPPFVCVAPLGGRAPVHFGGLARRFDPDRPFLAVDPPMFGVAGATPALEEVAAGCRAALEDARIEGPLLLGGYCSGGLIAFELARQWIAAGREVAALVLLNTAAHQSPDEGPPPGVEDPAYTLAFVAYLERMGGRAPVPLGIGAAALGPLSPEERLDLISRRACEAGAVREDTTAAEIRGTFDYFLAHGERRKEILNTYGPSLYAGRITLMRTGYKRRDPTLGWGRLATEVDVHVVAGDNATMLDEPHVGALGAVISRCLDAAPARSLPLAAKDPVILRE
jgi:amino acid adenylation domain-containing protein/non-ribosomal peptide synthase protein (TIGR01720 family)